MKKILITLAITLLSACSVPNNTNVPEISKIKNVNINPNSIKGVVQFPKINFTVKASFDDISKQSSVSIIYPPDSINANKVISSTVSDDNGNFDLNLTKNPENNEIVILEASKRLGGVSNNIVSLRTYIKWTGSEWQSMTSPNVYINSYTNALSIIAGYNKATISSSDLINKILIDSANNTVTPLDITDTNSNILVSSQTITQVKDLVDTALLENKDPFSSIIFDGLYRIDRTYEIGKLKNTGSCIECSFKGENMPKSLKDFDLSRADLSGQYLVEINFFNTNLQGANLSDSILSNRDLRVIANKNLSNTNMSNAVLDGINLSGSAGNGNLFNLTFSNLKNSDLTYASLMFTYLLYSDLSGADLRWADLSNAFLGATNFTGADLRDSNFNNAYLGTTDFTGADLRGADFNGAFVDHANFTGADLTDAIWKDGKLCEENSIGTCNK